MAYIFLNLKRFDIPKTKFGVNSIAEPAVWADYIVRNTQPGLTRWAEDCFVDFFPEAHLIPAAAAADPAVLSVGCQGLHTADTAQGGGFGAFTSSLTGNAARSLGCTWALIGHCEERAKLSGIIQAGGGTDLAAVNGILNREIRCAINAGLKVLYCIGEKAEEREDCETVLGEQIRRGLEGIDPAQVVLGYEPIWAIGPGKTPPGREAIQETARFIKQVSGGMPIVYGGGLKKDNAAMLASIPEIDGGLIALTRFSGDFGFYPDEYLEIIETYLNSK